MLAVSPGLLLADAVAVLANGHYSFIIPAQPETPTAPLSLKRVLLEPRRHYADDYKGVEEENVFGRQWAVWTDAVLTRARAKGHEGERLTLHRQSPLTLEWDDFLDSEAINEMLEWHRRQRAELMTMRPDGAMLDWCFYDEHTAAWVAELKRNGTLSEAEAEVPCPVRAESSAAALERALVYSTNFQADYDREETQRSVGRIEQAIVKKLGWSHSALFFAGSASVLEYPPGAAYELHTDCDVDDGSALASNGRIFSLVVYLNEPPSGGETEFDGTYDGTEPLRVKPRAGRALLWRNLHGSGPGECDRRTFHRALPPVGGPKMVLQIFFHMRPNPTLVGSAGRRILCDGSRSCRRYVADATYTREPADYDLADPYCQHRLYGQRNMSAVGYGEVPPFRGAIAAFGAAHHHTRSPSDHRNLALAFLKRAKAYTFRQRPLPMEAGRALKTAQWHALITLRMLRAPRPWKVNDHTTRRLSPLKQAAAFEGEMNWAIRGVKQGLEQVLREPNAGANQVNAAMRIIDRVPDPSSADSEAPDELLSRQEATWEQNIRNEIDGHYPGEGF